MGCRCAGRAASNSLTTCTPEEVATETAEAATVPVKAEAMGTAAAAMGPVTPVRAEATETAEAATAPARAEATGTTAAATVPVMAEATVFARRVAPDAHADRAGERRHGTCVVAEWTGSCVDGAIDGAKTGQATRTCTHQIILACSTS